MNLPKIIQGGMGAGVSGWRLSRAVAEAGHLGVVSGTALESILIRRLQDGDPQGHIRRALAKFPAPLVVEKILGRYFLESGRKQGEPYRAVPIYSMHPSRFLLETTVAANFVEVYLAKEGHSGLVGINYLEKIQLPNLAAIYGAMLAKVDYVLVGAGIPREIPGIMDKLSRHEPVTMSIDVKNAAPADHYAMSFNPLEIMPAGTPPPPRPQFLAIISSAALATILTRKATGQVNGFVIEHNTAGGHNAPPRGALKLDAQGEPIYGVKDEINWADMRAVGLPFWLAGGYGHPEKLKEALALGATGIQVGTAFAFCEESCLTRDIKDRVLRKVLDGTAHVATDAHASPTGYPFKVVQLEGTMSEPEEYARRERRCDLGYLRQVYKMSDGTVAYRCPGETISSYLLKEGDIKDTEGRKCLCNGLIGNIGMGQLLPGGISEWPIVTAGNDLQSLAHFVQPDQLNYTALDVIQYLTQEHSNSRQEAPVTAAQR